MLTRTCGIGCIAVAAVAAAATEDVWHTGGTITRGTFDSPWPSCTDWRLPAGRTGGVIHGSDMDNFFALEETTVERVKHCLGEGADPNLRGPDGGTALDSAARWSADPAVVEALLDAGANIDAAAVRSATSRQDTDVLALLLDRGVDAHAMNTALVVASSRPDAVGRRAARMLLKSGADANWRDQSGRTPLFDAAERGGAKMVALLLTAGAHTDATNAADETALHRAAHKNDDPLVAELLMNARADVDARAHDGDTPLLKALRQGRGAVAAALLEAGADPNARDGLGRTALHWAAAHCGPALARAVMDSGATLDATAKDGATALHFASRYGNDAVVNILLAEGADADAKDQQGRTASELRVDAFRATMRDAPVTGRRYAGSYSLRELSTSGDFDADGLADSAFLEPVHCRYALTVRFGHGAEVSVETLDSVEDMAVSLVPPGRYVETCLGECEGASRTIDLAADGIRLTKREGRDLLFRWRDGQFERAQLAER